MSNSSYNHPQKRRNLRRGIALALLIISVLVLISDRQQKSMLASGRLTADDMSSKVMGVFAIPIRGVETLFIGAQDRNNAYLDNNNLRTEIDRLRVYENQVHDLRQRVQRFENILGMGNSSNIPTNKIVTRAVSESNGPFVHSALINAGQNKGVHAGHAVMSVDGLYGHVVRSGSVSSRVLLLNDFNSRISVMSQRSQSRAILVGRNSAQPRLEYMSLEADWKTGDRVVTSGDGGVLPLGLLIGTVVAAKNNTLDVELFTQRRPIDWVWVLPFSPIVEPEIIQKSVTPTSEGSNE